MKVAVFQKANIEANNFSHRWIMELKKRGIEVMLFDLKDVIDTGKLTSCDGVMWHFTHNPDDKQSALRILNAIEMHLNKIVFPNFETRWHYDDKVSQYYLLKMIKAPLVNTWVFWKYEEAMNFIEKEANYPLIFKLAVGAGSANILKINSAGEAKKVVNRIFRRNIVPYSFNEYKPELVLKHPRQLLRRVTDSLRYIFKREYPPIDYYDIQKNYAYFQEYIPENHYDIRITVIGNRAFGFIRYNRPGDFRASGSGRIDYDIKKIPLECVQIAHDISKKCGFQSMAYDFLTSKNNEHLIGEISYCYVNSAVYGCSGFWDRNLNWHEGQMWPEEAHVEDFVNLINEKKKN